MTYQLPLNILIFNFLCRRHPYINNVPLKAHHHQKLKKASSCSMFLLDKHNTPFNACQVFFVKATGK